MTKKESLDAEMVRQLATLLNETDLNEIEYEAQDCRIRVAKHSRNEQVVTMAPPAVQGLMPGPHVQPVPAAPSIVPQPQDAAPKESARHAGAVSSPMVGVAYLASEPGAAPFIKVGDLVQEGQTLLIIEAMKVMNPIKAPRSGTVSEILVGDGDPVEFEESLVIIEN